MIMFSSRPAARMFVSFFLAGNVDVQIDGAGILADHHAFINPRAGRDENDASFLQDEKPHRAWIAPSRSETMAPLLRL